MNWFYNLIHTVQTHLHNIHKNIVNHYNPPMPPPVMKEITEEIIPEPKFVTGYIGPILFENLNPMFLNQQSEPDPELVPEPKTVTGCIITLPDIQPFLDKIPDIAPSNNYWKGYSYPIGDKITLPTPQGEFKDVQKHLEESAYYIWLETGADSQWCWAEAERRYGNE